MVSLKSCCFSEFKLPETLGPTADTRGYHVEQISVPVHLVSRRILRTLSHCAFQNLHSMRSGMSDGLVKEKSGRLDSHWDASQSVA